MTTADDHRHIGPDFGLELEVEVTLRSTSEGGRRTGIVDGYRPLSIFRRPDGSEVVVGLSELVVEGTLELGSTGGATLRFDRSVCALVESLASLGSQFDLAEGPRVIGSARVRGVRVLD